MKKQLFIIIVAGLTLLGTARRSAAATGTVTTSTNVQINGTNVPASTQNSNTTTVNGTTVPPTTTVTPSATTPTKPANSIIPPGLGTTVGTTVQGTINTTVTTAGTGAIQSGSTTLTTTATQQTAGISATLNKIPFVGGMANGLMQQKIAAGIGDLSKMATVKFAEMMNDPNNPLGGIGQTIAGWFGGGNSAQNAQQKAQDKTVADYQQGATDATTQMSKASKDQLDATERLLQANAGQTGDVGTTAAYVSGAKQVADLAMNANPASGNLTDKSAVEAKATQAIAESANGVAGQAALNSRVVNAAVNVAGMQSDASKTVDNSLDQLNIISGQLAKQGDINGEAVRIAAEQRTLLAAQLAQNGSDADARVRKEREEQRQKDYLLVNRTYNRGVVAGLTGAVKPSPIKLP